MYALEALIGLIKPSIEAFNFNLPSIPGVLNLSPKANITVLIF